MLLYLALVGVPLLGLLGILRIGRGITPPASVGGVWGIETAPASAAPCPGLLPRSENAVLRISQSGPHVGIEMVGGEVRLRGEIRGSVLTASTLAPTGPERIPACSPTAPLHLAATLHRGGGVDRLAGRIEAPGCPRCPALPFRATRRRAPEPEQRSH